MSRTFVVAERALVALASVFPLLGSVDAQAFTASAAPTSLATPEVGGIERAVAARLLRADEPGAALARELAALGLDAFAPLFVVLAEGAVPRTWLEPGEEAPELGAATLIALRDALVALTPRAFRPSLPRLASCWSSPEARVLALDLVAQAGSEADLVAALPVAAPPDAEGTPPRIVPRPVRDALHGAVREVRSRRALETRRTLRMAYERAPATLAAPIISGIADGRTHEDFQLLVRWLGRQSGADAFLLRELGRCAEYLARPMPEQELADIAAFMNRAPTASRVLAIRLLGDLEDYALIPEWTALLEGSEGSEGPLADAAVHALAACTGRKYGRDARSWRAWYEVERSWWDERAEEQIEHVLHGSEGRVSAALQAIVRRRLNRHELARRICGVLARPESRYVVLGCGTLGQLGSRQALPDLVRLLGSSDPKIVSAAHAALVAITHLSPQPTYAAWSTVLDVEARLGRP